MGRRGRNRDYRNKVLALVEEAEPELHAELLELRSTNPPAYRKRIRKLVEQYYVEKPQKMMANRGAWWHAQHFDDETVLDQPYQWVRAALKRGNFDGRLDMLREAEARGRNRPVIFGLLDEAARWAEDAERERPPLPEGGGNWERAPRLGDDEA